MTKKLIFQPHEPNELGFTIETVIREETTCHEMIEESEGLLEEYEQRYLLLESRIELLALVDRKIDSEYAKGNIRLSIEERNELIGKISGQKSNVDGYKKILKVLEELKEELA